MCSDIALGRNRNVLIHGIPEPFRNEERQRERAVSPHVVNPLRTMQILEKFAIKTVLCLQIWLGDCNPGCRDHGQPWCNSIIHDMVAGSWHQIIE